jgi:hypothetical protein
VGEIDEEEPASAFISRGVKVDAQGKINSNQTSAGAETNPQGGLSRWRCGLCL